MLRFRIGRNSGRSNRRWRLFAPLVVVGMLNACTPVINIHGQKPNPDDLELVEVGQSTRKLYSVGRF